ncbi:SWIB/MDM2 domain-containing protein [Sphingomonas sp.]|uniref:SWIB/MDM2 domain-containing protein n=1 Tax=Sphingomonas sp. TaxID=28214 RepID=UPI003AFFCE08
MATTTKASAEKKPAAKKAGAEKKAPAEKKDGAHKTVQPSKELAAVVGDEPLKRTEVVSKVWDYIRKHELQNPKDKRQILADATLKKVVGKDEVSMFELNKHLSAHLK